MPGVAGVMIGSVPSASADGAQPVRIVLLDPEPELARVPVPSHAVPLDRCSDSSSDRAMPELFCGP